MERIIALFLAIALCLVLSACDGGSSTSKCTICKKTATHTFQGSGYCNSHYEDAVNWAFDHVAGK